MVLSLYFSHLSYLTMYRNHRGRRLLVNHKDRPGYTRGRGEHWKSFNDYWSFYDVDTPVFSSSIKGYAQNTTPNNSFHESIPKLSTSSNSINYSNNKYNANVVPQKSFGNSANVSQHQNATNFHKNKNNSKPAYKNQATQNNISANAQLSVPSTSKSHQQNGHVGLVGSSKTSAVKPRGKYHSSTFYNSCYSKKAVNVNTKTAPEKQQTNHSSIKSNQKTVQQPISTGASQSKSQICTVSTKDVVPTSNQSPSSSKVTEQQQEQNNHKKLPSPEKSTNNTTSTNKSNGTYKGKKNKFQKGPNGNKREQSITIMINTMKPFDEQCDEVITQLSITHERTEMVDLVRLEVEKCFQKGLDNVQAVVFGSNLSGIAFNNSDVDVFLKSQNLLTIAEVVPKIDNLRHSRLFYRIEKILGARVPIARAINKKTGISVNISFTSAHGITNSNLIKHLCSADPRVRQLIMIVLFWAKRHEIVSVRYVSSFCIIVLVIFYLQIVGIIPPLEKFLTSDKPNQWPSEVIEDKELLKNSNQEDLYSLLMGFFSLYSEVHFNQIVISPFSGQLLPAVYFSELQKDDMEKNLPQCFSNYITLIKESVQTPLQVSEMTIQDPTCLNVNMTKHLNSADVKIFQFACQTAHEVMNKVERNYGLTMVLSDYCIFVDKQCTAFWNLTCPETMLRDEWLKRIYEATRFVFSNILLMKISSLPVDERYKISVRNPSSGGPLLAYSIHTSFNIFNGKRDKILQSTLGSSELKKELATSNIMLNKEIGKNFDFVANVCVLSNYINRSVTVKLIRQGKSKNVGNFTQVISYLMGGNFKKYMALALEQAM